MRIFSLNRKYYVETTGDGGDGSTGGDDSKDNKSDKVDNYDDVWNTNNNQDANLAGNDVQNVNVINQQPVGTELTPEQKLASHIESLNLLDGFSPEAMADPEKAQEAMSQIAANTYAAAMKDANQIMAQQISSLREELQQETQDTLHGNAILSEMHTALPYTAKPAYKPIAENLIVKFQEQGKTPKEAIVEVGKYFAALSGDVQKGMPRNANNRMNGNQFNGSNNPTSDIVETEDWVNFLSAKPK